MPDPAPSSVELLALRGLPEVTPDTDLALALVAALPGPVAPDAQRLREGDVLVVSSKLVSKALGLRHAWDGDPGAKAALVARATRRVVAERRTPGGVTRIVEAEAGPVMAAAGIDASNTGRDGGLLLLPADPDAEAARLRSEVLALVPGVRRLGLVLSDTAGRPWRAGQTDLALGCAGLTVVEDHRGGVDHDGRALSVTSRAVADEIASAADLVKGKDTGVGAVLVRGLPASWTSPGEPGGARHLVRTGPSDWFALGHVEAVRAALGAAPATAGAERVGIPPVGEDALSERVARVVRLALLRVPTGSADVVLAPGHVVVQVAAPDDVTLGRLLARLEVAAVAEDLLAETDADGAEVTLRPRQA